MDSFTDPWVLVVALFLLVTLPLLLVSARLRQVIRVLLRIEAMNIRSMQKWK